MTKIIVITSKNNLKIITINHTIVIKDQIRINIRKEEVEVSKFSMWRKTHKEERSRITIKKKMNMIQVMEIIKEKVEEE